MTVFLILCSSQRDQMTRLCFQYLAIFSALKIRPKAYKLYKNELKTLPQTKETLNILPKIFKKWPKWWNFEKSGHTGSN